MNATRFGQNAERQRRLLKTVHSLAGLVGIWVGDYLA